MSSAIACSYLSDCQLLKALARVLDLPAVATTTAFTYLHRIRSSEHPCNLNSQELVAACIYVAAKAEEVNVSANHLINSARLLSQSGQRHLLQALAPLDLLHTLPAGTGNGLPGAPPGDQQQQQQSSSDTGAARVASLAAAAAEGQTALQQQQHQQHQQQPVDQAAAVVTGDDYYAAKDRLFIAEQVVLRLMSFQLRVQQPLKQLLNFCRLLGASKAVAAAAVCILNDAVAYTQLLLSQDAAVVAAAALQLAGQLVQQQQQQQQGVATVQDGQQSIQSRAVSGALDEPAAGRASWKAYSRMQHQHQQQQQQQRRHTHQGRSSRDAHSSADDRRRHSAADGYSERQRSLGDAVGRQERRHSSGSRAAGERWLTMTAGDVALRDGGWLAVVGLQQHEVAEVQQALQQLLASQQQQQQQQRSP